MNRSMKLGLATIVAAFVVSLVATEDAEARHRRHRRHRHGGCCGYVAPSCCGAPVAPACPTACGVATNACPGGVCGVAGGAYSGGHAAGYGAVPGTVNGQGALNQPTPATNGTGTFRQEQGTTTPEQNGATRSPSDRPPAPAGASNGTAGQPGAAGGASAPPPPPQEQ